MVKKAQKSILPGVLLGAAVILGVSTALCGLFALLISSGRAGEDSAELLTVLAALLASVAGGLTAWRRNGGMALISSAAAAGAAILVRLLLTVFSGSPVTGGLVAVSGAMLLGAGLTGGLVAGRPKKRR